MTLSPPVPQNWVANFNPQPADFNTYIRDAFNFLAGPPRLRVTANATQSGIANNTWTDIVFQSADEDNYSGWTSGSTNHYTAQVSGVYGITLRVCAATATGTTGILGLQYQVNGT